MAKAKPKTKPTTKRKKKRTTAKQLRRRRFLLGGAGLGALLGAGWLWHERWRYIVVHHSGGDSGDIALLHKVHRERQYLDPVDMVPYHFVIGNGRGLDMGAVVPTKRWTYRIWGAHVRKTARAHNAFGIGVCLIGDFERYAVPEAQYQALIRHIHALQTRYNIPRHAVLLHRHAPEQMTKCPGAHFPAERFYRDIL